MVERGLLGEAHTETQATQHTQGRAAQVSVFHAFEYVSASSEIGQGSTVLRLLSPAPRSVPDTVYWQQKCGLESKKHGDTVSNVFVSNFKYKK